MFLTVIRINLRQIKVNVGPPLPYQRGILRISVTPLLITNLFTIISPFRAVANIRQYKRSQATSSKTLNSLQDRALPTVTTHAVVGVQVECVHHTLLANKQADPRATFTIRCLILVLQMSLLIIARLIKSRVNTGYHGTRVKLTIDIGISVRVVHITNSTAGFLLSNLSAHRCHMLQVGTGTLNIVD